MKQKRKKKGANICLRYTPHSTQFHLLSSIQEMMLSETVIIACLEANNSAKSLVPRFALFILPSAIAALTRKDSLDFILNSSDLVCRLAFCVSRSPVPCHIA